MNRFTAWICGLGAMVALGLFVCALVFDPRPGPTAAPVPPIATEAVIQLQPDESAFITACGGFQVSTKMDMLIATTSCMGRARGFIDGHQMTIHLQHQFARDMKSVPMTGMWCVPPSTTDGQVMSAVVSWIRANPTQFHEVYDKYADRPLAAALSIISVSIHQTFPCKETTS